MQQKMVMKLNIEHLDIAQSYFKGKTELHGKNYTLNLQGHSSEKIIKFPFPVEKNQIVSIRLSGKKIFQ